jgi:hypothetical protein
MADTARQAKLRQMDAAVSYSPERRSFVQSFQENFPYYKAKENLPHGMYVGQLEIMQDGRWYRICQSHEPNITGRDYGIRPAYQTYWAGPEFSAINTSTEKQVASFSGGGFDLTVKGLSVAYEVGAFTDGYMKVQGGDTALGYQMLISGNDVATPNKDDGTKWDQKFRFYTKLPFGIDTSPTADVTGLHFKGNQYGCQKVSIDAQSVGGTDRYDFPKFYVGHSLTEVPYKWYYWSVVGGPGDAVGQEVISDVRASSSEVIPYSTTTGAPGDDAGKIVRKQRFFDQTPTADFTIFASQPYARIDVRSEISFLADAYIPIWIYPK